MLTRAVVCALILAAACRDPDVTPASPPARSAPPVAAAAANAPPRDFALGGGLEMRRPIVDGHLTIIPIALSASALAARPAGDDAMSLDDAMSQHLATVREIGDFYSVRVTNKASRPLFVMAGELVLGGRQDHAFHESFTLAPHKSRVVPVFCVERNRSSGGRVFESGHALVDLGLRRVMRTDQPAVWQHIDAEHAKLGITSPTSTYRDIAALQAAPAAVAHRDRLAAQLGDDVVGLAVAYDGQLVALDRFVTPALFREHAGELIGSYLAGDDGVHGERVAITPDAVRRFAADVANTRGSDKSTELLVPSAAAAVR